MEGNTLSKIENRLRRAARARRRLLPRARDGVPHSPANVNIAAVLSLAGIGFERTRFKVVADPARYNTHFITVRARSATQHQAPGKLPARKTENRLGVTAPAALKQAKSLVPHGT
jgi:aspartate dehydrogenase